MDWLTNLFGGVKTTVSDVANSNAAQKLLDLGEQYAEAALAQQTADAQAKQALKASAKTASTLPSWVVPAGIGLAAVLTVGLIVSISSRGK